jgi:hypothetical protein
MSTPEEASPHADTPSARTLARTTAPLIAMGASWAVRKAMVKAYEARTGKPAPVIYSREASVVSKVLWAATLAGVVALSEVVVWKMLADDD